MGRIGPSAAGRSEAAGGPNGSDRCDDEGDAPGRAAPCGRVQGHLDYRPWLSTGDEGVRQRHLGVANACALAANFRASGFEVIIADVLTQDTARQYRRDLPDCLIVHLAVAMNEARRRAATRTVWL